MGMSQTKPIDIDALRRRERLLTARFNFVFYPASAAFLTLGSMGLFIVLNAYTAGFPWDIHAAFVIMVMWFLVSWFTREEIQYERS